MDNHQIIAEPGIGRRLHFAAVDFTARPAMAWIWRQRHLAPILRFVHDEPGSKIVDIANALGLSRSTAQARVATLRRAGALEAEVEGNAVSLRLSKPALQAAVSRTDR